MPGVMTRCQSHPDAKSVAHQRHEVNQDIDIHDRDASATLLVGSLWHARLYGNNLTNQEGVSAAGPVLKSVNMYPEYRVEYRTRPRTVGLSLAYTF